MIIDRNLIQGTPEWHNARIGSPGASSFDKIITSTGKSSTQRKKYMHQLAGEILLGAKEESYKNAIMERGTELEPIARELFEKEMNLGVEEVGIIYPDDFMRDYHVSPDGLIINQNKGLEIKCPLLATHVEYLDKGKLPTKYICQIQGSLMITDYKSWFFMSYYPGLRPLIIEVQRDVSLIATLKKGVEAFCSELSVLVDRLQFG